MPRWDFQPPVVKFNDPGDHEVLLKGNHLSNKRIALLVTGSIASINVPSLARELRRYGADVQIFVTPDGIKCGANLTALAWSSWPNRVITEITEASEHLSLGRPFDLYLVAPATANTICKTAYGISDTIVTGALASALGRKVPIMMVPAMHGSLHTPILTEAAKKLDSLGVYFVQPYDAYGKHNFQDKDIIVMDVCRFLSQSSLKNVKILVTAGPTPVKIDSVRLITNKFSGKLGILISEELYRRGADAMLIQSSYGMRPPRYIPYQLVEGFDQYSATVEKLCLKYEYGVFSAAVADYRPKVILHGKTPSKGALTNIEMVNTHKVIDRVREINPNLKMISFKYEEGKYYEGLREIAIQRLENNGHTAVVATDGLCTHNGQQQAFIFHHFNRTKDSMSIMSNGPLTGKEQIAKEVANFIENLSKN